MRLQIRFAAIAAISISLGLAMAAQAEVREIRIARQFGLTYLPLLVIKNQKLIEKHTEKQGLPAAKVGWVQLSGAAATNDALLTGGVEYASAGIAPLMTIWDKTKGSAIEVKAVGGLDASSVFLNSNNPSVKTLKDFTEKDRIALPAVKVSVQSTMLQIAAEQVFGKGQHEKLDHLTVALPHPEALVALSSGKSEITAHFATAPFNHQELALPGVSKVISSYDIFGGPTTVNVLYATSKFRNENPKSFRAVLDALREAHAFIAANPAAAARIYVEEEGSKLSVEEVEKLLRDPTIRYTIEALNTHKFADFLHRVGRLKNKPESWRDYYFADLHDQPGS